MRRSAVYIMSAVRHEITTGLKGPTRIQSNGWNLTPCPDSTRQSLYRESALKPAKMKDNKDVAMRTYCTAVQAAHEKQPTFPTKVSGEGIEATIASIMLLFVSTKLSITPGNVCLSCIKSTKLTSWHASFCGEFAL
jgi:hypothetical protein